MFFREYYSFLSNFYGCEVPIMTADGMFLTAKSAEHAYQALKTTHARDQQKVLFCETAAQAKSLGRRVTLREGWESGVNVYTMMFVVNQKFAYNPDLMRRLIAVDEPLIEDNMWHDNYWGHCVCLDCIGKSSKNWLGKILEQTRRQGIARGVR